MEFLQQFINIFFELLIYAIFIRIILSWLGMNRKNRFYEFLHSITEPILKIARRLLPPIGMIDFSPIIALLALEIIRGLVMRLFY